MKKKLIEILHGFLFGMSCLMPGFDGGTMLFILGIYEKFTTSVAKLSKKPWTAIKELLFFGIGTIVGVLAAVLIVAICLDKFPLITASFFVGFVIATVPMVIKSMKGKKFTAGCAISMVAFILIGLLMAFGDKIGLPDMNFNEFNLWVMLYMFIVTVVAGGSMIIPGASGMTILLVFGMYTPLVGIFKEIIKGASKFDFTPLVNNLWVAIPFVIGVIIGIIGVAKILSKLFEKHANIVWSSILGLLAISPIAIYRDAYINKILPIIDTFKENIKLNIIFSFIFFIIGFASLMILDHYGHKKEKQKEEIKEVTEDVAA